MNDLWENIAAELQGTTDSLSTVLERHGAEDLEGDDDFLSFIDQTVFECACCGWWCEISEEVSADHGLDDLTCQDCVE